MLEIGRDGDRRKVIRVDQRLLEVQQLFGRVEIALAPRRVALQKLVRKLHVREAHRPETMASAGVPLQIDLRAVRGAHDFDAMLDHLRGDVALVGERGLDLLFAALVGAVIETLARFRLKVLERDLDALELRSVAADDDALLAHDHRLAGLDLKGRAILARLGPLQFAGDVGAVVAERLERGVDLLCGMLEQPAHLDRRNVAVLVLMQLDAGAHRLQYLAFDTLDNNGHALGAHGRSTEKTEKNGQEGRSHC